MLVWPPLIGGVPSQPKAAAEIIACVRLELPDGVLAAHIAAEEVRVFGEHPGARGSLCEPVSDRLRDADLRPERPSIGPDVDEMRRVVVAGGRYDEETRPERGGRLMSREFARRECGASHQDRREPQRQIAQP